MAKEIEIDSRGFDEFILKAMADADKPVECVIRVDNAEAAKYWGVLEFGSTPGDKPWPESGKKTQRGMGGRQGRIMSRQAPAGFVFRYADKFYKFLTDAVLNRLRLKKALLNHEDLVDAANDAGVQALDLIRASVPVDTGKLHDAINLEKAK